MHLEFNTSYRVFPLDYWASHRLRTREDGMERLMSTQFCAREGVDCLMIHCLNIMAPSPKCFPPYVCSLSPVPSDHRLLSTVTSVDPDGKARKAFGDKTIGFWGSVCLNLNNGVGPAMVSHFLNPPTMARRCHCFSFLFLISHPPSPL